jgi:hypothetical protein
MNHLEARCVSQITLGCNTYTKAHAIAIIKKSSRTDETYRLATQLIAAKLNAGCAAHTDSSCVASTIARLRIDGCVRIRLGAMSRRAVPPGVLPATLENAAGTAAATVVRS